MDNNYVHLIGTVKRDATEGDGILDFAVEVPNERGVRNIFDCRMTKRSNAWEQLEGFVNEGEPIEIVGHLEKRTSTESARLAGAFVEVRATKLFVYVDNVITED